MNDVECCDSYQVHEDMVRVINDKMSGEDKLYDLAEIFKAFGDSARIKVLYVFLGTEMYAYDIAQLLDMNQSAISHQLRALKQNRLVKSRRDSKAVFHSLADSHARTIVNQSMEHVEEQVLLQMPMVRGWSMKYR